jgi:probable phosphoglycerate mutase
VAVDRIVGGALGDQGLSPLGVRQCEALRDRLARTKELDPVEAVVSSTLRRAFESAEIVAPALGVTADDIVRAEDLSELNPGLGDGLHWEEFARRYGAPDMRGDPYLRMAPGGESIAEFQLRAGRALARVAGEHAGETVVIACHGGIVDTAMVTLLGIPRFGTYTRFQTANASLTEWVLEDGAPCWTLVRYNDAAHLQ